MSGNDLGHQFRMGKLTHLMERFEIGTGPNGQDIYNCAFCDLKITAKNLRDARHVAEDTYGKCKSN